MKDDKPTDTSQLNYHYGLALEEIKLERSINNIASLMNGFNSEARPQYLMKEIAHQEKQLYSLRKLRSLKL